MKDFTKAALNATGKWARFFITRYRITILIILLIGIGGFAGFLNLPREGFPDVEIPFGIVQTVYPGASPTDVESDITKPIEDKISELKEVEDISSTSAEGSSTLFITFKADADLDQTNQQLREKVSQTQTDLPEDALTPQVIEIDAGGGFDFVVNVTGPLGAEELTQAAEKISEDIEDIDGVASTSLQGQTDPQIEIKLNQKKIAALGLSVNQIEGIIQAANINLPGGTITENDKDTIVQIRNRFADINELKDLTVGAAGPRVIKLSDIAEVAESSSAADYLSITGYKDNGESKVGPAVSIFVQKTDESSATAISEDLKNYISGLDDSKLENMELSTETAPVLVWDQGAIVQQQLDELTTSAWQGLIVILIVLFIFISIRSSIVIGLALPFTLLTVFLVFDLWGMTLNTLTIFSLVLVLGIIVDNAIVIIEGIQQNLQAGLTRKESAIKAVRDFGPAIISATLTTVIVFVPMVFIGGITGEFVKFIPYTVITAILASLFVALTIIPILAAVSLKRKSKDRLKKFDLFWKNRVRKILSKRWTIVLAAIIPIIILFASTSVFPTGLLKIDIWPSIEDSDYLQIDVDLETNTTFEKSQDILQKITDKVVAEEEVVSTAASEGMAISGDVSIIVNLTNYLDRDIKSSQISQDLRDQLGSDFEGASITIRDANYGPPQPDFPIEIQVTGNNLDDLKKAATEIGTFLAEKDEVAKVQDGVADQETTQVFIDLDRDKVVLAGLTPFDISTAIQTVLQPDELTKLRNEATGQSTPIILTTKSDQTIDSIRNLELASTTRGNIKLQDIAEIKTETRLSKIDRFNGDRFIEVKAAVKKGTDTAPIIQSVQDEFQNGRLKDLNLENDALTFRGDFEEEQNAFNDIGQTFLIAAILIFIILVAQFNSFVQPFVIMLTIPFSLIGVLLGLGFTSQPFSFMAMLGVIALAGIVVNDAIVLVDQINRLRKEGAGLKDAIIKSVELRARPIMSTSLTTIGGIFPLIIISTYWQPFGFSLIFGLIIATITALLVIPAYYYIFNSWARKITARFKKPQQS